MLRVLAENAFVTVAEIWPILRENLWLLEISKETDLHNTELDDIQADHSQFERPNEIWGDSKEPRLDSITTRNKLLGRIFQESELICTDFQE
jgi:hypothetical protein